MDPVLFTSLNSYISTLRFARFALLRIPACSKSNNTNTRLMAFVLSLTLDPMFGIHSHKTSGNAQLLHLLRPTEKLSFFYSTSVPANFSSHLSHHKLYSSVCLSLSFSVCVYVCECVWNAGMVISTCMYCVHIVFYPRQPYSIISKNEVVSNHFHEHSQKRFPEFPCRRIKLGMVIKVFHSIHSLHTFRE